MVTRRGVLKVMGGGVILAAGGAGAFAMTRTPTKALAPWDAAGGETEPRRRALSYAILAPNPHNRQPWMVDLSTPDVVVVQRDRTKDLPATDPLDRQLTIGMGCFLEQLAVAASQTGHRVAFDLFPDGEDGPVAVARFSDGAAADPLAAHIPDRRSCKEPFADTPVAADARLSALADIHTDSGMVERVKALTWDAWMVEVTTPHTMGESVDLFRMGKAEINAQPDGIDLGGPFLDALIMVGGLTRDGQRDPHSNEFQQGLAMFRKMMMATPAYAVVRTAGNTRTDQIEAGRRWLRLNLTTTALGLALHPVSQALQEYAEMAEHYAAAHALLAQPGETVQMLGRLGYGPSVPPSPRWPLDAKVIDA